MRRALLVSIAASALLACGPAPSPESAAASGTLVVVIRQGAQKVPFNPKAARIQRANDQLAKILRHSLQIELDGSLLPQTKDGAEDLIARLVEDVARDVDGLGWDAKAIAFARTHFDRLIVRYSPAGANGVALDLESKTIDVSCGLVSPRGRGAPDARFQRGDVATAIHRAFAAGKSARYAHVLPDALSREEQRSWFEYHARGADAGSRDDDRWARVGSVDALRVRGMVMLHGLATRANDAELVKDVRAWLVQAVSDFSSTYHHHASEVETAPPGSSFRQAESVWIGWIRGELPRMSVEEKGRIASHLFVVDLRKDESERDRFASYSFPGLDPMAFSFDAVDAWMAAGHPSASGPQQDFYRWALGNRSREDALVSGVLGRADEPFATATFYNALRTLRDEPDYLRFLRRFESAPPLWKIGADVHAESVFRPSTALLEESRRWWRELPPARGQALFWFARAIDGSSHPEADLPDLLQGSRADEATLVTYLDLGWDAFELLPAAWAGVAKGTGRMRVVTAHARPLLSADVPSRPGRKNLAGTLAAVAGALCAEHSTSELAELRSFAQTELAAHPEAGLSELVEATDPKHCVGKDRR